MKLCTHISEGSWIGARTEEGCVTCEVRTPQPDACETAGRRQRRRALNPPASFVRQSAAGQRASRPSEPLVARRECSPTPSDDDL
ncbi:jg23696 [Pararge aegeria aegeria]|uniref:Jg23696 protein n=1 Tax=Pararge aegeria aegeria TaxID=348720 RepID=A0A8S4QRY2_9NEOP|nr:jg23696 [Pararge aegeria aegeria]